MRVCLAMVLVSLLSAAVLGQEKHPTTRPAQVADGKLPHIQVDIPHQRVKLECEAVDADAPLEFLVCLAGTKEHETVLRTRAKPSHLHFALVLIGLEPGDPAHYVEREDRWVAPSGPALKITCQFMRDGKLISMPATRLMRLAESKKAAPEHTWVFCGSRVAEQGGYAADITGDVISVVNFQHTVIDVPELKSERNESLELEVNTEVAPKRDTVVWLIIEPQSRSAAGK
jgi:hypothetical protein